MALIAFYSLYGGVPVLVLIPKFELPIFRSARPERPSCPTPLELQSPLAPGALP